MYKDFTRIVILVHVDLYIQIIKTFLTKYI